MDVANIDFDQALAFTVLDDLHMGQRPRNTVAHGGKASIVALTTGTIGYSKNLREQAGVAGFAVGEQDQLMTISKALGRVFQQTPDERLIALPLYMRHDKLAQRVDDFRFPLWLAFILSIAMSLISLQSHNFQILYTLIMKGFGMSADLPIQACHHTRMDPCQPSRGCQRTPLRKMFGDSYRLFLSHFRVPQRRVLPLAELCTAHSAAQIPNCVLPIRLAYRQVVLPRLSVQFAPFIHTC